MKKILRILARVRWWLRRRWLDIGLITFVVAAVVASVFYRSILWPLAKPTTVSEFWAMVGGVAGVLVLGVAVVGLKALVLTRRGLLTQSTRDSLAAAIAQAEKFETSIIPANEAVLTALNDLKMPVFMEGERAIVIDKPDDAQIERAKAWFAKLPSDVRSECIKMLNRLEAWSMHFTSGLADENVVEASCGPLFVTMVLQLYPVMIVVRLPQSAGKYPNTIRLLKSWLAAMEERELGLREGHLQRQLAAVQSRAKPPGVRLEKPVGTSDVDYE